MALLAIAGCGGSTPGKAKDGGPDAAGDGSMGDAAAAATLTVTPATHAFGTAETGKTTAAFSFTVTNTGLGTSGALTASITGQDMALFAIATNGCTAALAPNLTCTITVTFAPDVAGTKMAALQVTGKGTEKATAILTGTGAAPAALTLTPTTPAFGSVVAGQSSATVDVTVTNAGGVDTGVPAAALSGSDAAQFAIANSTCTATLAPMATCKVTLKFNPTAAGAKTATLTVSATPGGMATAALTGTGLAPGSLSISPSTFSYDNVFLGATSTAQVFTITNTGGTATAVVTATIGGLNPNQFSITNSTCTAAIAPAGTCTVTVVFKPTGAGAKMATVTVTDGVKTVDGAISGNGVSNAMISMSPTVNNFGSVTIGTSGAPIGFTVTNNGGAISGTLSVTLGGTDSGQFSIVSSGCTANTLASGASCSISVGFNPTSAGSKTATLTVAGTPGGTVVATLSGSGLTAGALSISPATGNFNDVVTGQTSVAQTFTVTNNGQSASGVLATALGGANPTEFPIVTGGNGCAGIALAPAATCVVSITLQPNSIGSKAATFTVSGNPGGSAMAGLSGNALAPAALSVTPTQQDFGSVATGASSANTTFTIMNTGGVATSTIASALSGANADQFGIVATNCTTLNAGAICTVSVNFSPTSLGPKGAQLNVSATTGGAVAAALTGTAISPGSLAISPSLKNYGDIVVDQALTQVFTLTNDGAPNTGAITASLTGPSAATDFSITANTCTTLIQNATCTITVRFLPPSAGAKAATLNVNAASAGLVLTSALTGNGLNKLTILPIGPINFGTNIPAKIIAGPTQDFVVTCTAGGVTCGPLTTTLAAGIESVFSVNACSGNTVASGSTCNITVRFAPQTSGAKAGTLSVTGNPKENVSVSLSGTSVAPLTIAPTPHVYADTTIGSTVVQSFTVTYANGVPATSDLSTVLSGADSSQFAIVGNSCAGQSIAAGGTCSVQVLFVPTSIGAKAATLTVSGATGESAAASLSGNGVPGASLSISPPSKDFGGIFTGSTSASQTFTVTNTAGSGTSGTLTFGIALSTGFTITGGTCTTAALAGGASCTIIATFGPAAGSVAGGRSAALTVSATPGGTATAPLSGVALSPITISPTTFDFGAHPKNTTVDQAFTVKNVSATALASPLAVSVVNDGGNPANSPQLTLLSNTCAGLLAASATCTVTVHFDTGNDNNSFTRTGSVTVSGTNVSATATLSGTRIGQAVLAFVGAPTAIDFGTVWVGSISSSTAQFTVTNTGGLTSAGVNATFTGADAAQFTVAAGGTCVLGTTTLAPGASCTFNVQFQPTSAGSKTTSLTATATGAASTSGVTLTGVGQATTNLIIAPTPEDFGSIVAGQVSGVHSFTVSNPNSGTTSGALVPAVAGNFALAAGGTCAAALAPGASCTVNVTYNPLLAATPGTLDTGTLTVAGGGAAGTATAALTGRVRKPATLEINPTDTSIDFGQVAVGTQATYAVSVRNTGDVASGVVSIVLSGTDMAHYAITTNTCTVALAANAACSFGIQFAPTTPGPKNAAVQISATPGGTINMTLTGSAQPQAALSISPTQKDFGTGALTSTSATTNQVFTILNAAGAVPTGTLSFALPDADFAIVGSTCPSVLAGGDSCTITVQLQPKVIAAYNTTVSVSATPGGTASATITGNGVSALTITPSGAFPGTAVGAQSELTFTVKNDATAVQTGILSTSLSGTSFGQFGIVSDSCAGAHLVTGGTCTIVARFVPTSVGAKTASLTVSETPGISTATANLSGTGGP